MKKILPIIIVIISSNVFSQAPNFDWAVKVEKNTTNSMDLCFNYDVVTDNVGNVYYLGSYGGPAVFNLPGQRGAIFQN